MSIKVFAVDDEEYIRDILELNLKNIKDIDLKVFSDALTLIESLNHLKPDIIISDIIMPDFDGIELCKYIKNDRRYSDIYFILLTAKITVDDKVSGLEAGADDYITKPFKFKELIARLNVGGRLIKAQRDNLELIGRLKQKNASLEKAYDELNQASKKIIAAEKLSAVGKLSSIIAHELKNPLTVISNNMQVLEKNAVIPLEIFESIKNSIDYSVNMLNKFSTFSVNAIQNFENVDLNILISEALLNLAIPANIDIDFQCKDGIIINCDKFSLKIVIINILKNAAEKIGANKGKIIISISRDNEFAVLKIIDNGQHIPSGIDIFESFTTTKKGGLGLGLAFSKMIVEAQRGFISAENIDNGVCFSVRIRLS